MAKVTSKLQVTIPKVIADRFGIRPGDAIDFEPAGEVIRVVPPGRRRERWSKADRLHFFDQATARQGHRQEAREKSGGQRETATSVGDRGWRREDLYTRGQPD